MGLGLSPLPVSAQHVWDHQGPGAEGRCVLGGPQAHLSCAGGKGPSLLPGHPCQEQVVHKASDQLCWPGGAPRAKDRPLSLGPTWRLPRTQRACARVCLCGHTCTHALTVGPSLSGEQRGRLQSSPGRFLRLLVVQKPRPKLTWPGPTPVLVTPGPVHPLGCCGQPVSLSHTPEKAASRFALGQGTVRCLGDIV